MTPQTDPRAGAAVKAADRAHVFHSWSAQELIDPLAVAGAEGSYFWDYDGNRYLDFTSGLVYTNVGYQHPKVVAAIQEQAARLTTFAPAFAVEARSEAARLIAERTPATSTRSSSPTAAPTPSSTRCAWPGCTPAAPRSCRPTARTTAAPSRP